MSGSTVARSGLYVLPPDPGRKHGNVLGIFHKGGGWYTVTCFGRSKKCKSGACRHVRGLGIKFPSAEVRRCRAEPQEPSDGGGSRA